VTHADISPFTRTAITASIMLATLMNSLDTTIANVALPHMQGSFQASQEQISWVLTSYILASAIMTPMTSWLAQRFGRKELFLISIALFTGASVLCGVATSLWQIVLFRVLQGLGGAALIPLSQAELLDINPPEKHGQAMAIWGAGTVLGPVLGPVLGGYITDHLTWRWVFLINLPVGIFAFMGVLFYIKREKAGVQRPFDFIGFGALTLALAGLQLMLDRGPTRDWFSTAEIWTYLAIAGLGAYWFVIHTMTAKHPFFDPRVFADGNFVMSSIIGFFVGTMLFGSIALLPTMLQSLMGYPVTTAGIISMPRGLGAFISMFLVGQLIGRVSLRALAFAGLALNAIGTYMMTLINLQMDDSIIIASGLIQGLGTGLIFIPLSALAFATMPPTLRTEGASLFTLIRNLGGAVGISLLQAFHLNQVQGAHAGLVEHLRPDNLNVYAYLGADLTAPIGQTMVEGMVYRQAAMQAYVADFRVLFIVSLLSAPLLLLMRTPKKTSPQVVHAVAD
jgi:DHA2 family multidrug resistance protein